MDSIEVKNEENLPEKQPIAVTASLIRPSSKRLLFLGIIIGVIVCFIAVGVSAYFFLKSGKKKIETTSRVLPTPTMISQVTSVSTLIWLDKPQEISSVLVFKKKTNLPVDVNYYLTEEAKFFKVAELPDGSSLINSYLSTEGPGGAFIIRFIENKDKKYICLVNYLDEWLGKSINNILLPEVLLEEREIEGLASPEIIESGNKKFIKIRVLNETFDILKEPRKIIDFQFGPIYEDVQKILESDEIYARGLYLRLKDNTLVSYKLKVNFYSDNGVPEIFLSINPGLKNQTVFTQRLASSCSSAMMDSTPIIRDGSTLIYGKKEIGKTSDGDLIYQVFEPTSKLVKILYKYYSEGRSYEGGPSIETIEQMAAATNHFLWRDPLGDWQIFQNNQYELMAECGKPVIYLYPVEKTEVVVKVEALIRKSEPEYKKEGWRVTAYPDGKLIYGDKKYDSLFWEGLGKGFYPDLKNYGFVVAQDDLLSTIRKHLGLLGLNEKETDDFLQFWAEKLPKTPYVRLTWFGTREMDILAPLEVIPEPDTKIRIFLDFEGLEKPISLRPQRLSSVKRVGFTLVEWGGLLTGSHK